MQTSTTHALDLDTSTLDELRTFVETTRDMPGDAVVRAGIRYRGAKHGTNMIKRLHVETGT